MAIVVKDVVVIVDAEIDTPDEGSCIANVGMIQSVISAMLTTIYIQMGVTLAAGILIHVLVGTLNLSREGTVTETMVVLGFFMYFCAIRALSLACTLPATETNPLPSLTDPGSIAQILVAYRTEKSRLLCCFRRYNYFCCLGPTFSVFVYTALTPCFVTATERMDLVLWPVSLGLVVSGLFLTFGIYNHTMLGKYKDRLDKFDVLDGIIRQETLAIAESETVTFDVQPGTLDSTVSVRSLKLDMILQSKLDP